MPILIKSLESSILPHYVGDVKYIKSVIGDVEREDFVNLIGFKAYLQNMSRIEYTKSLQKPINFGLRNTVPSVTLEINY